MKYIKGIEAYQDTRNSAITLGKFDGLHLGHELLVSRVEEHQIQDDVVGIVFAFDMRPMLKKLNKPYWVLLTNEEKAARLDGRVDYFIDCPFDESIASMEAEDFIKKTGVDALAVAIGTAHGAYKEKPRLDIERLKEIRATVDTPLVLHGGSGLSDEDFRNTVREGIAKVNIFTDLCNAGIAAMKEGTEKGLSYLEIRDMKVQAIKEVVKNKIRLFGSENKA